MDEDIRDITLFSRDEANLVQSTWRSMVMKDGTAEAGLTLLYRFFGEFPEVRTLFYRTEVDNLPENFTKDDLRRKQKFYKHARSVGSTLDFLINNMTCDENFIKKCTNLGLAHRKHKVELRHFDMLGVVLIGIIERVLEIDASDPTSKAWRKTYGTIADYIKRGSYNEDKSYGWDGTSEWIWIR